MKKLLLMLTSLVLISLILPEQVKAQSCCLTKPTCQVITCIESSSAEVKSASAEVNVPKAEAANQVAKITFASFLHPVLNASSALFANQMVALMNQIANCDPADCDPDCCIIPICDPSCDISKCSVKKD